MRILIYGINYAPELTGIGKYTGELGAFLTERGDEVDVITAPPYYPAWAIRAPYANTWRKERIGGATVMRSPLYVPAHQSGVKRILHEVAFVLSSLRWWVPRMFRRYDAIVAVSPPFHLGALPLLHKWLHGTPVVNHIQDLQVDAARDLGLLRSERLLGLLESVERWLLQPHDARLDHQRGYAAQSVEQGCRARRHVAHPQLGGSGGGVSASAKPVPAYAFWRKPRNQGRPLRRQPRPETGPRRHPARGRRDFRRRSSSSSARAARRPISMRQVQELGLGNVQFEPLQPLGDLAAMLAVADVHLVLQKRAAADLVMPSKLTNIVAAGGHAVVTAEPGTTLYDVVSIEKIGTLVAPEDDAALVAGIRRVLSGEAAGDVAGLAAFAKTLDRDAILDDLRARLGALPTH